VSLGITVEHQEAAELRVPELMTIPEGGGPTFVSYEPALGPVDWTAVAWRAAAFSATRRGSRALPLVNAFTGEVSIRNGSRRPELVAGSKLRPIGWLIAGGESGSKARPSNPDWFRMARDQAAVAGVPFLFKQWGEWVPPVVGGWWSPRWEPDARTGTVRVGKARAGRLLDDVDHNARPMFPAFHGVLPAAPL